MTINEQETALRRLLEPAAETQGSLSTTIAASVAISLKRIADALERPDPEAKIVLTERGKFVLKFGPTDTGSVT